MMHLILVACFDGFVLRLPAVIARHYGSDSEMQCAITAQQRIAVWNEEHPQWRVVALALPVRDRAEAMTLRAEPAARHGVDAGCMSGAKISTAEKRQRKESFAMSHRMVDQTNHAPAHPAIRVTISADSGDRDRGSRDRDRLGPARPPAGYGRSRLERRLRSGRIRSARRLRPAGRRQLRLWRSTRRIWIRRKRLA